MRNYFTFCVVYVTRLQSDDGCTRVFALGDDSNFLTLHEGLLL